MAKSFESIVSSDFRVWGAAPSEPQSAATASDITVDSDRLVTGANGPTVYAFDGMDDAPTAQDAPFADGIFVMVDGIGVQVQGDRMMMVRDYGELIVVDDQAPQTAVGDAFTGLF